MKKIHMLSDSPFMPTGYSTITREILNRLSTTYECSVSAHNFQGNPLPRGLHLRDGAPLDFEIYGAGRGPYCSDVIEDRVKKLRPDIFGVLLDSFMLYPWVLDKNFSPAKSFFYFPSDGGGGLPVGAKEVLGRFHKAVAMSKFAQQQAKEAGIDSVYIPLAVNPEQFRRLSLEEKQSVRSDMEVKTVNGTIVKGLLRGKYVVGVVARNQGRKMLDKTIEAFSLFCKDKPEALLYLHCDPDDPAAVFDIRELIRRFNVINRVIFSPIRWNENLDYYEMNRVYNVMDTFLLTTSGEGFGIPIVEAMSCEVPVVVTDYTTTRELLGEGEEAAGFAVKVAVEQTGTNTVDRAIIDARAAEEALTALYNEPDLRASQGACGRQRVLEYYTWDVVMPMWHEFLERLSP